jgi:hypothetical protein
VRTIIAGTPAFLMTFTHPLAWGLLLLAIPIILFFLLKVRLRKELVTTTIFWQQVFEERRIRTLHRRFRYFVSLLLALLFLTFLTAAVLEPAFYTEQNNRCVIIIDNSASMNVRLSPTETRLDFAKQQAQKRLAQLAAGQQAAIITANVNPKIVLGFTDNANTLRRKLAEISGTDYPGDMLTAIQLAEELMGGQPDAPIYIYSARAGGIRSPTLGGNSSEGVSPPLMRSDNIAITRFQPRRLPEHATDYEIFVEVVNFGTATVQTHIEIDCEGKIVDVLPLSLEPNKPVTKIVRNTSADGGLFRAKLASTDSFPTDDVAVAFLSKQFVQRIFLYGTENYFLRHVLQVQPQTAVTLIDAVPDSLLPDCVLVCHQTIPSTLPTGNVIVIDPQNDCDLFQVGERLERPMAAKIDADSSLMRFIPSGLIFAGAKNVVPQNNHSKTLAATAEELPLYQQLSYPEVSRSTATLPALEHNKVLVLSADLNQGDLALHTAFPILISQALAYFRNSEDLQKAYSTAEPVKLTLPTEKTQIILRSPSGREEIFPCRDGVVSLGRLGECGVWTVFESETGRELTRIACNLFNATESDLRSAIEPMQSAAEVDTWFVRPLWYYLALLALLLTATEWWLYQRRWIE